jgi:hypothetical protein
LNADSENYRSVLALLARHKTLVSAAADPRHPAADLRLSHSRDHRPRTAQSACRIQTLPRQAVLQRPAALRRIPQTHRYTVTGYGLKVIFFHAKLYFRILRRSWAVSLPKDDQLPRTLRAVLDRVDHEIAILREEAALVA